MIYDWIESLFIRMMTESCGKFILKRENLVVFSSQLAQNIDIPSIIIFLADHGDHHHAVDVAHAQG